MKVFTTLSEGNGPTVLKLSQQRIYKYQHREVSNEAKKVLLR